jgi:aminocarboxymuconate-semialdehyde decarboxylase
MNPFVFSCGPRQAALSTRARGGVKSHATIDMHCHVHIHEADELLKDWLAPQNEPMLRFASALTRATNREQMLSLRPKLTSVSARLEDMDRLGIDIQVISPSPFQFCYWAPPEAGLAAARVVNDAIAAIVASSPDRFVGLGTVPLQAPDLAVAELDRLIKDLGMRGVEIAGSVGDHELSHERYRPFFSRAQELDALLFMHPNGYTEGGRLADHYLINIVGNPLEATVALSHLIFDGVLEDLPSLKLCVAHGGGFLPAYAGRMDHAHRVRPDCRRRIHAIPSSYLKRLYFDTVVFNPTQLEVLIREYGADHVVLGSDYPYDMAESDPVGFVRGLKSLTDAEVGAVLGGNAARLLNL